MFTAWHLVFPSNAFLSSGILKCFRAWLSMAISMQRKGKRKVQESHNYKPQPIPSQTPRGRDNSRNQTSANRKNVRKAPRLGLSLPQARYLQC